MRNCGTDGNSAADLFLGNKFRVWKKAPDFFNVDFQTIFTLLLDLVMNLSFCATTEKVKTTIGSDSPTWKMF